MATDELLLDRIRNIMSGKKIVWKEKKMFGGDCFMVDDKMCFGTYKGGLMVRVSPEESDKLIRRKGADRMVHGGRPMAGYVFVRPSGYDDDKNLEFWITKCLEFNPRALSSRKRV